MLTHMHPSLKWFSCKSRSVFNGAVSLALSPELSKTRHVPRAPLPDGGVTSIDVPSSAARQRALPLLHRSYELMRQTKSLLSCSVFPIRQVFAGCCQSLLGDGPSRCYLCNPYIGAWTLTPGCPSSALIRFFPESYSLTLVAQSSAHPTIATMPLLRRPPFRGGSHSVMFKLPCSLALQMAPTTQARSPTGSQGVYTTQWTGSYLPELWYRYMTESDNYHGGTFTRWIAALSAATCNLGVTPGRGYKLL